MKMKHIKQDLQDRGFLHQFTHEKVFDIFDKGGNSFYLWVDCSANSMTIGNFIALMMAVHFALRGNKMYLLVWWATSTIWNPSGKDDERPILSEEDLIKNQAGITAQFEKLTHNISHITGKKIDYEIVNNYDFHKNMNVLDYLREVGRFMTVNWMISKDIVKKRITDPDKWISYAEFSYMLIMGYDYYHLWKHHNVTLEVGGSDEWDGILSGIELISKKEAGEVYGVTNALITDANGKKFGKSEGNAIWLDETKTSPYDMYQYFVNTHDDDVERYLKLFTFMWDEEISNIIREHNSSPELRHGQKKLAYMVVKMIHGEENARVSEKITEFLFGEEDKIELLKSLCVEEFEIFYKEIGGAKYQDQNLFGLFIESGLEQSWSTARQTMKNGGMYINEKNITDGYYDFSGDFIDGRFLLLRKGKKHYRIIMRSSI